MCVWVCIYNYIGNIERFYKISAISFEISCLVLLIY